MGSLEFKKITMPAAELNGESSLPAVASMINVQQRTKTVLDEDDGLFIGFGFMPTSFPYRQQDMYGRELTDTEFDAAVLENKYLRATFIPALGGRLWSLFDKVAGKELTFSNPVFRPCNLAIRNAWFSGGVEWNCGMVGHHPFTCSQLFVGKLTADDGTPVLRMYEFERIRAAVYQMDFFLPDDSKVLLCRMRIVNPTADTVPMYWWSNIAVPELPRGRVVMPTNETFSNKDGMISKTSVPVSNDIDITYPVNNPHAIDFFWKLSAEARKYVCQLDENGYGLIQTSTSRLKGRKLFVWGQGPGGDKWQEFLCVPGQGRYAEIQAGVAHTQYECLPMPPKSAWEWLEAYGAMNADGAKVHGDWEDAKAEVGTKLEEMIAEEELERILKETRQSIALKPAELIASGSGWGALENLRREKNGEPSLPDHLDFGSVGEEQQSWAYLLENGYFSDACPQTAPLSWMGQAEWFEMMVKAVNGADAYNWYAWLQAGMAYFSKKDFQSAKHALGRSMELKASCWALYGLAHVARVEGDKEKATMLAFRASRMKPDDASLAKEAMRMLTEGGQHGRALQLYAQLTPEVAALGRIRLFAAVAYVGAGNLEAAEAILYEGGGIVVPDMREGEVSLTDLWYTIEEKKAAAKGETFDRENAVPPAQIDFRMGAVKKK